VNASVPGGSLIGEVVPGPSLVREDGPKSAEQSRGRGNRRRSSSGGNPAAPGCRDGKPPAARPPRPAAAPYIRAPPGSLRSRSKYSRARQRIPPRARQLPRATGAQQPPDQPAPALHLHHPSPKSASRRGGERTGRMGAEITYRGSESGETPFELPWMFRFAIEIGTWSQG